MSSPASFDVLHEVSKGLADDFIDEDQSQIEIGRQSVTNRTVTVRGRYRDRSLVIQYADFWSESISAVAPAAFERNVLEIFVAQSRVTFDGTCKERGVFDKIARWFGGGGLKGDHAVFERTRIDADGTRNMACLLYAPFADALAEMGEDPACLRVKLQAGSGAGPLLDWRGERSSPAEVFAWIDRTIGMIATLD